MVQALNGDTPPPATATRPEATNLDDARDNEEIGGYIDCCAVTPDYVLVYGWAHHRSDTVHVTPVIGDTPVPDAHFIVVRGARLDVSEHVGDTSGSPLGFALVARVNGALPDGLRLALRLAARDQSRTLTPEQEPVSLETVFDRFASFTPVQRQRVSDAIRDVLSGHRAISAEFKPNSEPGTYFGHIDRVDETAIVGWAARTGDTRPLELEVLLDDVVVAKSWTSIERPDVCEVSGLQLAAGFSLPLSQFAIPAHFRAAAAPGPLLAVRIAGTDLYLPSGDGPLHLPPGALATFPRLVSPVDLAEQDPSDAEPVQLHTSSLPRRPSSPVLRAQPLEPQAIASDTLLRCGTIDIHFEHVCADGKLLILDGWAFDHSHPTRHVRVEFRSEGVLLGLAIAADVRVDLAEAGYGSGDHGFALCLPARAKQHDAIELFVNGNRVQCDAPIFEKRSYHAPPRAFSYIERLDRDGPDLLVSGWVLDAQRPSMRFSIHAVLQGTAVATIACEPRPILAEAGFGDGGYGFTLRFAGAATLDTCPDLELAFGASVARVPTLDLLHTPARRSSPVQSPSSLMGEVTYDRGRLSGWVAHPEKPGPLDVEITVDGSRLWVGTARRLVSLSGGQVRAPVGFCVDIPESRSSVLFRRVEVRTSKGEEVPGSPVIALHGGHYDGRVEKVVTLLDGQCEVRGWCINYRHPAEPVELRIEDSTGRTIASGIADLQREDLRSLGLDTPVGGFAIRIPPESTNRPIDVLPRGCIAAIPKAADFSLQPSLPERLADLPQFVTALDTVSGTVDEVSTTRVRGWARCDADGNKVVYVDLFVDDVRIATTCARRFRPDLAKYFGDHGCHEYLFELWGPQLWEAPGKVEVRPTIGKGTIRAKIAQLPFARITPTGVSGPINHLKALYYRPTGRRLPEKLPRVSLIVLNQNGGALLDRLFSSFASYNTYPDLEFVIVDHASTDNSGDKCRDWASRFPIMFLERSHNYSFSESCNYGAAQATGDILLFLNNDVRLRGDIIQRVIERLYDPRVGCVGIKLLDDTPLPDGPRLSQPAVQHLGVHFRLTGGQYALQPFESRMSSALYPLVDSAIEVPAVTAAFLACHRDVFDRIGGFDVRYFYGYEDVDFCLKVLASGQKVVASNDIAALHLRGFTREKMGRESTPSRVRNRTVLDARFAAVIRRASAAERFRRPGFWSSCRPRIAFVVTEASDTTPAGDYFTAKGLADALSAEFPVDCVFVESTARELADLTGVDVVISMRDDFDPHRIKTHEPDVIFIAWVRNWFERFADRPFARAFHAIWASSEAGAALLREKLGRRVDVLPIATDLDAFSRGAPDETLSSDYCFTGSYWGLNREILQLLDPQTLPYRFAVFGAGWDHFGHLRDFARGPLPYSRMPDVYASTKIVIDDANHATKALGSVNSRVFDALNAGALVLTNGVVGANEMFDGQLPTFSSVQELEDLLHFYLNSPEERSRKVEHLQKVVRAKHTYAHRAHQAWGWLGTASVAVRVAIKIGAPRPDVQEEWGDFHFARGMQHALEELGYHVRIDCMSQWTNPASNADDVVIILRGLSAYKARPDQINLMWQISHPDKVSDYELNQYDHIFVASESHARTLQVRFGPKVTPLLQCTDARHFNPNVTPSDRGASVLFVGNSRDVYRPIVRDAISAGIDLHVYGTRWTGLIPSSYVKAEHIPNGELARHYRAAGVVLNDHWDSMREAGFISNRLFDAVACGARVISDGIEGLYDLFGDSVETYESVDDLRGRCLADETSREKRENREARARRVLAEHTFHNRMQVLDSIIRNILSSRVPLPSS